MSCDCQVPPATSKGGLFLEPVDPIALGIPKYTDIVKSPMDVSTLQQKLKRREYSNIPSVLLRGQDPVMRMLNGPFRKDVELIFNTNAMLFNLPNDGIYQAASTIKKSVVRKIEQASGASENVILGRQRKQKSVYVDYDSDVNIYVYESDQQDDDYGTARKRKKQQSATRMPAKEDAAARGIERGIRVQKILTETLGKCGPLANLPIQLNASDFTLPPE
jgi:hypothetical protein